MPPNTYQEVIRDFVGTPLSRWLQRLFGNSSSNVQVSAPSTQDGQPNLIISKSKGAYKAVLPHSLIAFGEGEQCRWYVVINPLQPLQGATGKIKYLYEINLSGSTKLSDAIKPEDCSYVLKRGLYYKRSSSHRPTSQFQLASNCETWRHGAKLTGLVTGQGTANLAPFFHIRQGINLERRLKPELRLQRVHGPDFWSIHYDINFAFPRPTLAQIVGWSISAIQELQRIHGLGIIHGDIAIENLMLDRPTNQVKFVDFGYGDYIQLNSKFFKARRGRYSSLEDYLLADRTPNTVSSDIYSFGMALGRLYGAPTSDNNIHFFEDDCIEKIVEKFYNYRAEYKGNFMNWFKEHFGVSDVIEKQPILQKIQDIIFGFTATFDSNRMKLSDALGKFKEVQQLLLSEPRLASAQAKVANHNSNKIFATVWRDMQRVSYQCLNAVWGRIVAAAAEKLRQAKFAAKEPIMYSRFGAMF